MSTVAGHPYVHNPLPSESVLTAGPRRAGLEHPGHHLSVAEHRTGLDQWGGPANSQTQFWKAILLEVFDCDGE